MTQQDTQPPAETLAPCPFCGSPDASMSYSATMQSPEPANRFVECGDCGSMGPYVKVAGDDAAAQALASTTWNSRAALTRRAGGDAIPAGERLALRAIKAVTATGKDGPRALSRIMAIASSAGVKEQYSELLADPDVALIVDRPRTEWAHLFKPGATGCAIPPDGWECSRERGHDGPCAATPKPPAGGEAGSASGTFACPICGEDTPHHHTPPVVDAYQTKGSRK